MGFGERQAAEVQHFDDLTRSLYSYLDILYTLPIIRATYYNTLLHDYF